MCHVLRSVTEGRDADNFGGPYKKQIEDLGRCVNPAQPSPLSVTSDIRIICHVESAVVERAKCDHELRKHHPGSTKECLVALQTEVWEMLGVFEVFDSQLAIAKVSKPPQGDLRIGETNQRAHGSVNAEPPVSVLPIGEYVRLQG